jgi:hypothetical protein
MNEHRFGKGVEREEDRSEKGGDILDFRENEELDYRFP